MSNPYTHSDHYHISNDMKRMQKDNNAYLLENFLQEVKKHKLKENQTVSHDETWLNKRVQEIVGLGTF